MTPFVPDSAGLPLKWFRHPPRGRWVYTLDMFAADKGPAQITLSVNAWNPDSFEADRRIRLPSQLMGSVGYMYKDQLPEWVLGRMAVLAIAEEGVYVEHVGVRHHEVKWQKTTYNRVAGTFALDKEIAHESRWYLFDVYTP